MIIRKRFETLEDAQLYSRDKAYYSSYSTESEVENVIFWHDIYKYLHRLVQSKEYRTGDVVDIRRAIADNHAKLLESLELAEMVFDGYYDRVRVTEDIPEEDLVRYKASLDTLLYSINIFFNRIRVLRKIMLDRGSVAPEIPETTLNRIMTIYRRYPIDLLACNPFR